MSVLHILQWLPPLIAALGSLASVIRGLHRRRQARELAALPAAPVPDPHLHESAASAVISALRQGKKLAAITTYRAATGTGLKQAKVAVEALERWLHDQRRSPP